jgi:hypothetical protein
MGPWIVGDRRGRRSSFAARCAAASCIAVCLVLGLLYCLRVDAAGAPGKAAPKKATPPAVATVERNLPSWTATRGALPKDAKKVTGKETVFDLFVETAACKMQKPFVVYFYWPEDDKANPTLNKKCAALEKSLSEAPLTRQAIASFGRFLCNAQKLDKKIKSKFAATVPAIQVYDPAGKKLQSLTSIGNDKALAKQLETIKKNAEKLVGKASAVDEKAKKGESASKKVVKKKGGEEDGAGAGDAKKGGEKKKGGDEGGEGGGAQVR